MSRLLVNTPTGLQQIVEISPEGAYFDLSRVIWDERTDGPLPEIVIGKMQRIDEQLVQLEDYLPEHAAAVYAASIPHEITMRQAELALRESGHLAEVQSWVAETGDDLESYWRRSQTIRRDHQYVEAARLELNLTQAQMDQLFILAATKEG